uniref:BRO-N domain-containing protein n=1 Tax=Microbulbifer agarilyticus TaxID=260552 RepID=UPI0002559175|nr:BRO family protein [Microbulbifer agarilyticus]
MNELTINDVTTLNFEGQPLKVVQREGEPYWIAKEVCDILGYKNARQALLDQVEPEDILRCHSTDAQTLTGNSKARSLNLINEAGLYGLAFGSTLKSAKRFKRWVFKEVLPSIRKHGGYIQGQDELTDLQKAVLNGTAQSLTAALRYVERETKHLFWLSPAKQSQYLNRIMDNAASRYRLPMELVEAVSRFGVADVQKELTV